MKPFGLLLDIPYNLKLIAQPIVWLSLIPILTICILATGLYPALILASYKAIDVLKTKTNTSPSSKWVRKILIGMQFAISILLIGCTLIMAHQGYFLRNQEIGFETENRIIIEKPQLVPVKEYMGSVPNFVDELKSLPGIKNATASYTIPSFSTFGINLWKASETRENQVDILINRVDENYLSTFGIKLLAGRNFRKLKSYPNTGFIVSEKLIRQLGFASPEEAIGEMVKLNMYPKTPDRTFEIIGVMDNYMHLAFYDAGMVLMRGEDNFMNPKFITLTTEKGASVTETLKKSKELFQSFYPDNLFDYLFLDANFKKQYKDISRNTNLVSIFSIIAILLACVGVIGLSSFISFMKYKEVAIRKIYGASKAAIAWELAKEFVGVLVIAFIITIPLILYVMNLWLSDFNTHIQISIWHMVTTIVMLSLITFLVSFYNISKAIKTPPVAALED